MILSVWPTSNITLLNSQQIGVEQLLPFLELLSPAALQRHHRFQRPLRRRQFLLGRLLLRYALAELLQVPCSEITLTEQGNLPPKLPGPVPVAGISLSHSGHWIACAVSLHTRVGLDIEVLDGKRNFSALASQAFDARELAAFSALSAEQQMSGFYRLWSQKEARYKLGASTDHHDYVLAHEALSVALAADGQLKQLPLLCPLSWPQLTAALLP